MVKIFYITSQKLKELKEEYRKVKKTLSLKKSGEASQFLPSEEVNEEFLLFQENLNFLYSRKQELENILKNYRLIRLPPEKERNKVHLGARVVLEVEDREDELEIVGTLEANPMMGKISNESPVGKALMNKRAGEAVAVSSPIETIYKIKKITYLKKKK